MAGNVFNIAQVKLNGTDYGTKAGATFKLGGLKGTAQFASGRVSGPSFEPEEATVTFTYEVKSQSDLEAIRNFRGDCTMVMDTGQEYTTTNAWMAETVEIGAGDGLKCVVKGDPAERTA